MSGSVRMDAKFRTIEQEAPLVPNPARVVEIFTQDKHIYLRIGPVEGVNPAHGSYTLMLSVDGAASGAGFSTRPRTRASLPSSAMTSSTP